MNKNNIETTVRLLFLTQNFYPKTISEITQKCFKSENDFETICNLLI